LIGLVTLVITAALLWLLLRTLFHWFDNQKVSVRTAIIGAIAVIGVPVVTYFTNRAIDRHRAVNEALRLKKVELYEDIFRFYMSVFGGDIPGRPKPSENEVAQFIADTKPRLLAYSSNQVIKAWGSMWGGSGPSKDEIENTLALEKLMKAFRQDLGHGSRTLRDFDIGRLFISGIDETLKARKLAKRGEKTARRASRLHRRSKRLVSREPTGTPNLEAAPSEPAPIEPDTGQASVP
jgi:hypothetical protein